jgi:hypothetical protein
MYKLIVNEFQAKDTEIEHFKRLLWARDHEVAGLHSVLSKRSDELKISNSSTIELQKQLSHQKHLMYALIERVEDNQNQSMASQDTASSNATQEAIIRALDKEIHIYAMAKQACKRAAIYERHELPSLIRTVIKDNTSFGLDLEWIRHRIVELEAPFEFTKHKSMLVKEIERLMDWLEFVAGDLAKRSDEVRDEAVESPFTHVEECDERIASLVGLAKLCGVCERLDMALASGEEEED